MKTVILLLCAVLIGFGYLLSEYIKGQQDIAQLLQQVNQLKVDNQALHNQNSEILAKLDWSEQARRELAEQNAAQARTIADQKRLIADLQTRVALLQTLDRIQGALSNVLQAGIFLPVIPALLATTYLVVRSHKHAPRKSKATTGSRSTWVQLTDHEVQTLIRLRRKQYS